MTILIYSFPRVEIKPTTVALQSHVFGPTPRRRLNILILKNIPFKWSDSVITDKQLSQHVKKKLSPYQKNILIQKNVIINKFIMKKYLLFFIL